MSLLDWLLKFLPLHGWHILNLISLVPFFYANLSVLSLSNITSETLTLGCSLWNQKLKTKFISHVSVSFFGYGEVAVVWFDVVLYSVWSFSFLCVVVDLKPTASLTEPVHKPEGKWQSATQGLSVDCRWHTPIPDEIGSSYGLTLNPSPIDAFTFLQKFVLLE